MKDPQLSGIAKALAAHGRKGDTELVHVSKKELETLEKYGEGLGIHLTKNPTTGLPEAFNWGGTLGSVALPLAILATVGTGGAASPWLLAAAGAAGGAGGTMLTGGSTDEALMSGLMGGIGGYGMGSLAGSFAQAGVEAAATEAGTQALTQAGTEAAGQAGTQALTQGATDVAAQNTLQQLAQQGGQQSLQSISALNAAGGTNALGSALPVAAEGMTPAAGSVVGGSFVPTQAAAAPLQSAPMTGLQQMAKGVGAITSSPSALGTFAMDNASNVGMAGIGALGAGTSSQSTGAIYTEPENTGSNYTAEWYVDPATGQPRTRAVAKAAGGEVFGDYDGVEMAADGGYVPGGIAAAAKAKDDAAFQQKWTDRYSQGFAEGGYTGPRDGDAIRAIMQAQQQEQDKANQLESYRALWPIMSVSGRQNEAADMRRALDAEDEKRSPFNSPAIRHIAGLPQEKQQMAMGGIANLGHYSDGGSLLRGPGNGTSDNIPATIEGRRPARLADGEFVVPSRIVSELGNGSTEAGARELYKMMDRVQARRRKTVGKNKIAHDANARSELPA